MEQLNLFHKGIVSGLDYSLVKNDNWVFPSQNIRVINREGKGLIVTLLKGVEKEFSITEGFEAIGAVMFDQILYVVSYSISKRVCEIGCYPSPASYTITSKNIVVETGMSGFVPEYKLLPNYYAPAFFGGDYSRKGFHLNKLPYDQKSILDIIAVPSYDESIDLIILDGVSANKMINTGFDKAGFLNTRLLKDEDFSGSLDLIKTSDKYPYVNDFVANISSEEPFMANNYDLQVYKQVVPANTKTNIHWNLNPTERVRMDHEIIHSPNYNIVGGNGQYLAGRTGDFKIGVYVNLSVRSYYSLPIQLPAPHTCEFTMRLMRDRNGVKTAIDSFSQTINTGSIFHSLVHLNLPAKKYFLMSGDILTVEIASTVISFTNKLSFPALFELQVNQAGTYWFMNNESDLANSVKLNNGGRLLPGNYYFFLRYSTFDYNRTQFLTSIGPISVAENDRMGDVEGGKYDIPTTRKIDFNLNNFDLSYDYYEIGVVRYFGELGYLQRDVYLINNKYSTKESKLVITGLEDQAPLDFSEVANHQGIEKICKTHRIINNRYYGANWTGLNVNYKTLSDLALKIKLRYTLEETLIDTNINDLESVAPEITNADLFYGYKSVNNIISKTGYHRGATVPFAIQFILTDDTRTPAFPVTGYDCYDSGYRKENSKGLFRFPFYINELMIKLKINNINNVLGIKYEMDEFIQFFDSMHLNHLIKGFVFVRGDEVENLLYQGVACQMINGQVMNVPNSTPEADVSFPIFQTGVPCLDYFSDSVGGGKDYSDARYRSWPISEQGIYGNSYESINPRMLALYSPDLLFSQVNKTFSSGKYYMQIIGVAESNSGSNMIRLSDSSLAPDEYARDIQDFSTIIYPPEAVDTMIVDKGNNPLFGGKTVMSKALPGEFINIIGSGGGANLVIQNRTMVTPRYMAILLGRDLPTDTNQINYLVNIYSSNPEAEDYFDLIVSNFNPYNKTYSQFSAPVVGQLNIRELAYTMYGGNSFQTRIYFRQMHWESLYDICEERGDDTPDHHYFAHGLLLGMLVESFVNPALRHGDMENTYYPKLRLQQVMENNESVEGNALLFVRNKADFYIYESFFYNSGYNKSIVDSLIYGYDPAIPFMRKRYPGRIRASAKHNDNSFMSGYSIYSPQNYVDFDKQIGEINYLGSVNDELVSVSESRIIQHFIDEKALMADDGVQSIVLGHGPIISEQYKILAEYGSQHRNGVKNAGDNMYGVDIRSKVIWCVVGQTSQFGKMILSSVNLSMDNMIESELDKIYEELGIVSNKITPFADNTIVGSGVTIGYDPLEKEVYFIFKKETDLKGLVYSEKIGAFTGYYDNVSPYFVHSKDVLMSYFNGSFYRHNNGVLRHDGKIINAILTYIVNGTSGEPNTMTLPKVYESLMIDMPEINLETIDYETEDQSARKEPFNSGQENYDDPIYENGKWIVPIILSEHTKGQYQDGSELSGTWMKITLSWKANNSIFIRSIRTLFNLLKP